MLNQIEDGGERGFPKVSAKEGDLMKFGGGLKDEVRNWPERMAIEDIGMEDEQRGWAEKMA